MNHKSMDEYQYELRIPHDRIAVLIGKDGETKLELEKETNTKLVIDSKEGDVFIQGEDALGLFVCREVVRAISRGFNPDIAKLLLKQDYAFEIVSLAIAAGKSKNALLRLKGRVIGSEGKARTTIEELTECHISVYGKTIGVIGEVTKVPLARMAIEMLVKGATHASVFRILEKKRRDLKRMEFLGPEDILKDKQAK